jgi:hypothetical protein
MKLETIPPLNRNLETQAQFGLPRKGRDKKFGQEDYKGCKVETRILPEACRSPTRGRNSLGSNEAQDDELGGSFPLIKPVDVSPLIGQGSLGQGSGGYCALYLAP